MGGPPGHPGHNPMGGPPPGGPQWGPGPGRPPGPYGQPPAGPYGQPPHHQQPKKKKGGCGCGCLTFALMFLVVIVLAYLQFWDVWDWMYDIFGVGLPQGMSDPFVWD